MAAADGAHWDARYDNRASDQSADVTPAPPDALIDAGLIDRVPTAGRALDVACGLGAQTIWLAQRGLDVTSLDASSVAIESLRSGAESLDARFDGHLPGHHHPIARRIDARHHDLDTGLPDDVGDLNVIVCQRFRDPNLYPAFFERLARGGILVITVLSRTGATDPGPFHAPPGELRTAFDCAGLTILHHCEADGQESIIASTRAVNAPIRFA